MNSLTTQAPGTTPIQRHILGLRVDVTSYAFAVERVIWAAKNSIPFWLCPTSVHTVTDAHANPSFGAVMKTASMITTDGMPLVWALRLLGEPTAQRVYGPTLMEKLLQAAADEDIPVGFYGASPETISKLQEACSRRWPSLHVAYAVSPPYRPPTAEEAAETVRQITNSGVRLLFVGLGCPKQEIWARDHYEKLKMPIIVVGAAFDFIAGTKPQAPRWMQSMGCEWFFRLITEPRRLWKRYLVANPTFILLLLAQLTGLRFRENRTGKAD